MIKPHEPFQDGSKHAANEYCPTCHGHMNPNLWDSDGRLTPDSQRMQVKSNEQSRQDVLMSFSQTGIAGRPTPSDEMLADIIIRLIRVEAFLKAQQAGPK